MTRYQLIPRWSARVGKIFEHDLSNHWVFDATICAAEMPPSASPRTSSPGDGAGGASKECEKRSRGDRLFIVVSHVIHQHVLRRLSSNKRCPGTIWPVASPADSRAHLFGASSRGSWCRQPQTIAETRVPTIRPPFPRRRVAQPGQARRIGVGQTTGDAILSRDL
jgi:hypothetical protein